MANTAANTASANAAANTMFDVDFESMDVYDPGKINSDDVIVAIQYKCIDNNNPYIGSISTEGLSTFVITDGRELDTNTGDFRFVPEDDKFIARLKRKIKKTNHNVVGICLNPNLFTIGTEFIWFRHGESINGFATMYLKIKDDVLTNPDINKANMIRSALFGTIKNFGTVEEINKYCKTTITAADIGTIINSILEQAARTCKTSSNTPNAQLNEIGTAILTSFKDVQAIAQTCFTPVQVDIAFEHSELEKIETLENGFINGLRNYDVNQHYYVTRVRRAIDAADTQMNLVSN